MQNKNRLTYLDNFSAQFQPSEKLRKKFEGKPKKCLKKLVRGLTTRLHDKLQEKRLCTPIVQGTT